MTPATAAFAAELRRAMAERGITVDALVALSGVSVASVIHYRNGHRLPTRTYVEALADALRWPALRDIGLEGLTAPCLVCGATAFRSDRGKPAFCTETHRRTHYTRTHRAQQRETRAADARVRTLLLRRYQDAVLAMCRACEPAGKCRLPSCELRPVSPLRLASARDLVA